MDFDLGPLSQGSSTFDGYTRQFKDPVHDYSTINTLYLGLKGSAADHPACYFAL